MAIEFHDVFGLLAEAIPGFEPSAVDWLEPLSYIFLSQMVDHVCVREDDSEMTLLANLFEKLLTEGDDETRYLASLVYGGPSVHYQTVKYVWPVTRSEP